MKKEILLSLLVISIFIITGCSNNDINSQTIKDKQIINNDNESSVDKNMETITDISVIINGESYLAKIENNETTKAFMSMLPQEFNMKELNGNEKYIYMDNTLPTNPSNPKHIESGDIMLYENNCLVIFYKSFDTSYSYTKIGHIDNLPDLKDGNIKVKFEQRK